MPGERCDAVENRRRILAAAKELFATQGIDETSMQEIARAAGVGQGTLYRRFAHKGDLCGVLLADDLEAFRERAERALSGLEAGASALSRLEWLLAEQIRLTDSHILLCVAAQDAACGVRRSDVFKQQHHTWLFAHVARLLEKAQRSGEATEVDIAFTADTVLASFAPALLAYQRQELGYSLERIISGVTRLFLDGIRRGGPPRAAPYAAAGLD